MILPARGLLPLLAALAAGSGCGDERERLVLATTTSAYDSGLLPHLIADFEQDRPDLRVVALVVGTGEALTLARHGDVDVTLTHHEAAEVAALRAGVTSVRATVMSNLFLLAGPPSDPAAVAGATPVEALRRIAAGEARFVSRDDDSGTHRRELALWAAAGMPAPAGEPWYVRAGMGMADAIRLAGQREAYLLADEATFRMVGAAAGLVPLVEQDPLLENPYSVMVVRRTRRAEAAAAFAAWLTGPAGQGSIAAHDGGLGRGPLFRPAAGTE
jgi:tungstate transport system substrate-binding protein